MRPSLYPLFSPTPRLRAVKLMNYLISFVRSRRRLSLMLANQQRENRCQQHEDQRLDQTYEQLQKIKWNRYQPAKARHKPGHGFQHVLTGKNVAIETKTQGDR